MKVEGLDEILRLLKEYPDVVVSKAISPAMRRASTPTVRAIRRGYKNLRMPYSTGLLAKSIGKRQKTYRRAGTVFVGIGPRTGFSREVNGVRQDPSKYAHLVELGFFHAKSKTFIQGRPVMRSTFMRMSQPFMTQLHAEFSKELPKQEAKLHAKHGVKRGS